MKNHEWAAVNWLTAFRIVIQVPKILCFSLPQPNQLVKCGKPDTF